MIEREDDNVALPDGVKINNDERFYFNSFVAKNNRPASALFKSTFYAKNDSDNIEDKEKSSQREKLLDIISHDDGDSFESTHMSQLSKKKGFDIDAYILEYTKYYSGCHTSAQRHVILHYGPCLTDLQALSPVAEEVDVNCVDPFTLVYLKQFSFPVCSHWRNKNEFLMNRRFNLHYEDVYLLPPFIEETGISKVRQFLIEKDQKMNLRQKLRQRARPVSQSSSDISYQVLHDAFFRFSMHWQPNLSTLGEVFSEEEKMRKVKKNHQNNNNSNSTNNNSSTDTNLNASDSANTDDNDGKNRNNIKPGVLSQNLRSALGMSSSKFEPPPYLINMQKYFHLYSNRYRHQIYPIVEIPGVTCAPPSGFSSSPFYSLWTVIISEKDDDNNLNTHSNNNNNNNNNNSNNNNTKQEKQEKEEMEEKNENDENNNDGSNSTKHKIYKRQKKDEIENIKRMSDQILEWIKHDKNIKNDSHQNLNCTQNIFDGSSFDDEYRFGALLDDDIVIK